jgi:hypothetical protein
MGLVENLNLIGLNGVKMAERFHLQQTLVLLAKASA